MDAYRVLQVAPDCEDEVLHSAYRALALKYHPDRDATQFAARRMSELNQAYALVRDPTKRARHDAARRRASGTTIQPASSGGAPPPPPRSTAAGSRLTFGRYAGWTLRDLARQDPDYVRWLSRHTSGIRYRTEIYAILGKMATGAA
ncbi:MAG TPA: DnaJ domain-containing protein [Candidatus Limnocylindria bacterium]|jgi:curved DNA-binding protein CbpA